MVWKAETSNGNESAKIKWEVIHYLRGRGLDIGCGAWKVFPHCVGIDRMAFPGADGANIGADVTKLDFFADCAFDFVYSSHTLEDQDDTDATLREWWRVLRVGGYLVLYLPHKNFYPNVGQEGANPAHRHDFMPDDIIGAMERVAPDWDCLRSEERNGGTEYSFLQVFRKLAPGAGQQRSCDKPRPERTAAVVRYGAYGDAIWSSSVIAQLKRDGYHVTVYTQEAGEQVLRHDPHVDEFVVHADYIGGPNEMVLYWSTQAPKFDRWVNLVHSVEATLLPQPSDVAFHKSDTWRRANCDRNYLEAIHAYAEVDGPRLQKFYPTPDEVEWAKAQRARYDGPVVVLQPQGSTWSKFWPYTKRFAELMAERKAHVVVVGDYREERPQLPEHYGHWIGRDWDIRKVFAFAALADVVVGQESAVVNAVAYEAPLKVVLLSHSTPNNLTRDWPNTVAVFPDGDAMPCYPCHRIHPVPQYCTFEKHTKTSGCQAIATPDPIADIVFQYFDFLAEQEADLEAA